MKKNILIVLVLIGTYACQRPVSTKSGKETWVFLMAGQSNMAGRGVIEASDTITHPRILTIDKDYQLIRAKEPIHFYEPNMKGLDCGLSFAQNLIKELNDSVTILLIPTAVGGSSSKQWLRDTVHRHVKLLTNFREKMAFAKTQGIVKGILWHQGESDANPAATQVYTENLKKLFSTFRTYAANDKLPIFIGELGTYSKTPEQWNHINEAIRQYVSTDPYSFLISTADLQHKGDFVHFNSEGQRIMGKRFAEAFLKTMK